MSVPRFSTEEQQVIERYAAYTSSDWMYRLGHLFYLAPSLLFAIMGFIHRDYVGLLVAYLTLLGYGVYSLRQSHHWARHLPSILRKYADGVRQPRGAR